MSSPLVSVVIPAYNATETLGRCVTSVIAQTHTNLDIVIVDDKSTDDSVRTAMELAKLDSRIRLVQNKVNMGVGATCNAGLREARGEWVWIVDSDDSITPDRAATVLAAAAESGASIVFDNPVEIPIGKSAAEGKPLVPLDSALFGELSLATFARSISSITPLPNLGYLRAMFRRSLVEDGGVRFDEDLKVGEDSLFVCDLYAAGGDGYLIPHGGYLYFKREGSLSSEFGVDRIESMRNAFAGLLERHPGLAREDQAGILEVVDDLGMRLETKLLIDMTYRDVAAVVRRLSLARKDRVYIYRELRHRLKLGLLGLRRGKRSDSVAGDLHRSFLHVTRPGFEKGTVTILETWAAHPEWPELLVVGDHPALLDGHEPSRNVRVISGLAPRGQLEALMRLRVFHLGFPEPESLSDVQEAMPAGAIVVTSNAIPISEFIDPSSNYLVDWPDPLRSGRTGTICIDGAGLSSVVDDLLGRPEAELERLSSKDKLRRRAAWN